MIEEFDKNLYLDLLWQQFCAVIEADWDRHYQRRFGDFNGLDDRKQSYNFARAVQQNLFKCLQEKGLSGNEVPSVSTISNLIKNGGISPNSKNKTLDALSMYVGGKDWADFQIQSLTEQVIDLPFLPIEVAPEVLPITPEMVNTDENDRKSRTNIMYKGGGALALITLFFAFVYGLYWSIETPKVLEKIHQACMAEFTAYKNIDKFDTIFYKSFFSAKAPNRSQINYTLNKMHAGNCGLRVPPSYFHLAEARVQSLGWNTAKVHTVETWKLLWYYKDTNQDHLKYDVTNEQCYYMVWEDGTWKIDYNAYPGTHEILNEKQ